MYHCYAIILTLSLWSSCSTWFHWIFSLVLWFVAIAKLHLRKQISWMSLVGHCFFTEAFMWLKLGLDVIQCDSLSWTLLSDSVKVVFKLLIFLIFSADGRAADAVGRGPGRVPRQDGVDVGGWRHPAPTEEARPTDRLQAGRRWVSDTNFVSSAGLVLNVS